MFTKIINSGNNTLLPDRDYESSPRNRVFPSNLHAGERVWSELATNCRRRTLRRRGEILPIIEEILQELEVAGSSSKDRFAVRLALEEALVNAIKHGHQDDPRKEVQLSYLLTPEYLFVEIKDEGVGFDRKNVPDPLAPINQERSCGRGLLLMQHAMTWVHFNAAGNRVTMCRRRTI